MNLPIIGNMNISIIRDSAANTIHFFSEIPIQKLSFTIIVTIIIIFRNSVGNGSDDEYELVMYDYLTRENISDPCALPLDVTQFAGANGMCIVHLINGSCIHVIQFAGGMREISSIVILNNYSIDYGMAIK